MPLRHIKDKKKPTIKKCKFLELTVLKAVKLPAGVAHLDSGLADMDRDTFPHGVELVARF